MRKIKLFVFILHKMPTLGVFDTELYSKDEAEAKVNDFVASDDVNVIDIKVQSEGGMGVIMVDYMEGKQVSETSSN